MIATFLVESLPYIPYSFRGVPPGKYQVVLSVKTPGVLDEVS